jgi:hypothetical protein
MAAPSIVPDTPERDVYLVLDDFGPLGRAWSETDEGHTSREVLIQHLIEGQYNNPVRIIAFNTAAGWVRDVTAEITQEVRDRCTSASERLAR